MKAAAAPCTASASRRGGASPAIVVDARRVEAVEPERHVEAVQRPGPRGRRPREPVDPGRRHPPRASATLHDVRAEHVVGHEAADHAPPCPCAAGAGSRRGRRAGSRGTARSRRARAWPARTAACPWRESVTIVNSSSVVPRTSGLSAPTPARDRGERRLGQQVAVDRRTPRQPIVQERLRAGQRVSSGRGGWRHPEARFSRLLGHRGEAVARRRDAGEVRDLGRKRPRALGRHVETTRRRQRPHGVEQVLRGGHPEQCQHRAAAGGLARDRHARRVAAERRDVVAHPLERGDPVAHAAVATARPAM